MIGTDVDLVRVEPLHRSDAVPSIQRSGCHGTGAGRMRMCGLHRRPLMETDWCPACGGPDDAGAPSGASVPQSQVIYVSIPCPCHEAQP